MKRIKEKGRPADAGMDVSSPVGPPEEMERIDRARAFLAEGKFEEAERLAREVLSRSPGALPARGLLGQVALAARRYPEALAFFDDILAEMPGNLPVKSVRALTLLRIGRGEDARAEAEAVLAVDGNHQMALKVLATYWIDVNKDNEQAERCLSQILAHTPDEYEGLALYGKLCLQMGRYEDAKTYLKRAIKMRSSRPSPFHLLGSLYREQCRFRTALSFMRHAHRLDPDSVDTNHNYATLLVDTGRVHEGIQVYRRCLERNPDAHTMRFNLSTALLLVGQLEEGWEYYEARRDKDTYRDAGLPFPTWQGESLKGKRLLIISEQGVGDEILAANMFADAAEQAERCFVECDPRLTTLFGRSFPSMVFIPRQRQHIDLDRTQLPDYKALGLSLARRFRSRPENFPGRVGYLVPDPKRVDFWRWRVAQLGSGLKVGISWRSMMNTGVRRHHYTTLDEWEAIFKIPGIRFVNVQYDRCQDELNEAMARFGVEIANFKDVDLKDDLEDSAALISVLDVVIAPSNSVAMLAGALNVPLLEFSDHNNWPCLGTDHFPWFPSFQMFFRPWNGGWSGALSGIANEIARRAQTLAREERTAQSADEAALLQQRLARARLFLLQGNIDRARPICEEIVAVRENHDDALLLLGMIQQAGGDLAAAEAAFRRAVAAAPLFAEAFNCLGIVLLNGGRAAEAIIEFEHALGLRPQYTDALNNMGNAYAMQGQHDKALGCYRQAIDAFSGHVTARFNYALALEDTGNVEEAIIEYETVLDGNPTHAEAWNNLASLLGRAGRISEAESAFRNALRAAPDFVSAHVNLAKLLLRVGTKLDEAIDHLQQAAAQRPDDPRIANMLGVAYTATDSLEEAVSQFKRALVVSPGFIDAVRNLALTLQRMGRLEEARDVLVQGLHRQADLVPPGGAGG